MALPNVRSFSIVDGTFPAGTAVGDLVVAIVTCNGSGAALNPSPPTGWTYRLLVSNGVAGGDQAAIGVLLRPYQAGDVCPAFTGLVTGGGGGQEVIIVSVTNGKEVDAWQFDSFGTKSTTLTIPAVGPVHNANTLLLAAVHWNGNAEGISVSAPGLPAGWTNVGKSPSSSTPHGTVVDRQTGPATGGTSSVATASLGIATAIGVIGLAMAITDAVAPLASTLLTPAGGATLDASTAGMTFQARHNTSDSANCNAYCLRLKTSAGAYTYWNATTNAFVGAPVWNALAGVAPSGTVSVVIPAGKIANGSVYNWSIACQESFSNLQGPFAADATFTAQASPTVTVTGPTGTVTTTTRPTVAWTPGLPGGGVVQTKYRIIVEHGSYGTTPGAGTQDWDSGVVASAAVTAPVGVDLTNSLTFRVFVQITETGDIASAWGYSTFTLTLTPPVTPTLTGVVSTDPTTGFPRVELGVQGHDTGPTYTNANTTFEVDYSDDGGTTWAPLRGASALPANGSDAASLNDYEAAFGVARKYRASTAGTIGGNIVRSAYSSVITKTVTSDKSWLLDPTNVSTARSVWVSGMDTLTHDVDAAEHLPLADPDDTTTLTVVVYGAARGARGDVSFHAQSLAERNDLMTLLRSKRTLLLQLPPQSDDDSGERWYGAFYGVTESRLVKAKSPNRIVTATMVEAATP